MDVEAFDAMRGLSREKRASNRESSARLLAERGVSFESKNDGAHLIVRHNGNRVDFWPGTGKWMSRDLGRNGRGVFPLLRALGVGKRAASGGNEEQRGSDPRGEGSP